MVNPKLLLVEDDNTLAELLEFRFKSEGYLVRRTANGDQALEMAEEDPPDIVILDWMIEGTDGLEVCRRLRFRKQTTSVPIVMLTAMNGLEDRLRAFALGADHFVTKPFSPRVLLAHIGSVLRRARPAFAGEMIRVGDFQLDPVAKRVKRQGKILKLNPTDFRLLTYFLEHPRRVFSRPELVAAVWGAPGAVDERTVDMYIRRLRKAIQVGKYPDPIRTVRMAGYSLEPVQLAASDT